MPPIPRDSREVNKKILSFSFIERNAVACTSQHEIAPMPPTSRDSHEVNKKILTFSVIERQHEAVPISPAPRESHGGKTRCEYFCVV